MQGTQLKQTRITDSEQDLSHDETTFDRLNSEYENLIDSLKSQSFTDCDLDEASQVCSDSVCSCKRCYCNADSFLRDDAILDENCTSFCGEIYKGLCKVL